MYGTVARFRMKPGSEAALSELMREYETVHIRGALGEYVYRMDDDPNEYYMSIIFDSKESYMANADSPEQDARYRKFRDLLENDPEWHDGDIIYAMNFASTVSEGGR